jgi:hypothetical protein
VFRNIEERTFDFLKAFLPVEICVDNDWANDVGINGESLYSGDKIVVHCSIPLGVLVHEMSHWIVASDRRRKCLNYDLAEFGSRDCDEAYEDATLLSDHLILRHLANKGFCSEKASASWLSYCGVDTEFRDENKGTELHDAVLARVKEYFGHDLIPDGTYRSLLIDGPVPWVEFQ